MRKPSLRKTIKKLIPAELFSQIEPYGHLIEAIIAQIRYGFPSKGMDIIGVTGTDGKTTTCSLIASVLRGGGYRVGVITTAYVDYGDGKGEQVNRTNLTTGNAFALNSLIEQIKANDVDWLIIEVSSHALNQRRTWGIPFSIVAMTNMSNEHLDYHKTFERYRSAKERLFKQANRNHRGLQLGIVNQDDQTAEYFAKDIKNVITYGIDSGYLQAKNIKSNLSGNTFQLTTASKTTKFHTNLLGAFNIYNSLIAVAVGQNLEMTDQQIANGLANLKLVNGRMMPINEGQDFSVLIDYAVTPWALQNVLETVRSLAGKGRVHIVFGATGDRDKTKRPAMGEVTSRLADFVYLTNDETYTENAESIRKAVLSGVKGENINKVSEYSERRNAIRSAIDTAKKGDVVIISGIGHQSSINMSGQKVAWSDIDEARSAILNRQVS